MGKKIKEQRKSSKTIDIVSYALKVTVNSVSLTVNIHVSTKTCVTGNNFTPHKALITDQLQ